MSFDTWYREIPIVTRCYLTASVLTTVACFFDLVSPFSLYLNYRLIWEKYEVSMPLLSPPPRPTPPPPALFRPGGADRRAPRRLLTCSTQDTPLGARAASAAGREQVWRLFTNFFFFGMPSLDFGFHMYFLVRYCRLLEEGPSFRGRSADFFTMLLCPPSPPRPTAAPARCSRAARAACVAGADAGAGGGRAGSERCSCW
jgi:hypothetical protein